MPVAEQYPVGTLIRVTALPEDVADSPLATRAAFELALGKEYRVAGHGPYGHLELVLGDAADAALGGYMNTLWIEPWLVEKVG